MKGFSRIIVNGSKRMIDLTGSNILSSDRGADIEVKFSELGDDVFEIRVRSRTSLFFFQPWLRGETNVTVILNEVLEGLKGHLA